MSFRIAIAPNRRASARFIDVVRRTLQARFAERKAQGRLTQTMIAEALGVHRSVISRELRGVKDLSLGRVGELAWAMGLEPRFELDVPEVSAGANQDLTPEGIQIRSGPSTESTAEVRTYSNQAGTFGEAGIRVLS
jgi:hypothetical protein